MTFVHYLLRLANVTKIAKFNLPSIYVVYASFICVLIRMICINSKKNSVHIGTCVLIRKNVIRLL